MYVLHAYLLLHFTIRRAQDLYVCILLLVNCYRGFSLRSVIESKETCSLFSVEKLQLKRVSWRIFFEGIRLRWFCPRPAADVKKKKSVSKVD